LHVSGSASQLASFRGTSATDYRTEYYRTGTRIGLVAWDSGEFRLQADDSSTANLTFYTGGAEKVRITSTGNVGIGTTTPLAKLDVNGTASVSGALSLYGTPTIASTALQTLTLGGTTTGNIQLSPGSATPSFVVTTAGQVGIGTTAPGAILDITKTGTAADHTLLRFRWFWRHKPKLLEKHRLAR